MATINYKDPVSGQWVEIPTGGTDITVDSSLSSTSENPVQNKVINSALNGKVSTTTYAAEGTFGLAQIWLDPTDNYLYIKTKNQ